MSNTRQCLSPLSRPSYWQSLAGLARRRELIWMLTLDELRRRYAGSVLGWAWVIVKPLLLLGLYVFVFGVVFEARSGSVNPSHYPIVIITGLIPWLLFAEAMASSASALTAHTNIVTKVVFPIEVLPVCHVLGVTLSWLFSVLVLVGIVVAAQGIGSAIVWFPVLLLLQVLLTIGLAWIVSTISVTVKDLSAAMPFLLTIWMFLSPVVYTQEMLPAHYAWILKFNPMTYLLESYRGVLIDHRAPQLTTFLLCVGISAAVFLGGFFLFYQRKAMLADEL